MTETTAPKWKDITSYSQGDKERIPTTFKIISGAVAITITSGHIYYPGKWVMHCHVLNIDTFHIRDNIKTRKDAQRAAIKIVKDKFKSLTENLNQIH